MSTTAVNRPATPAAIRNWATPLNLHWAALALLILLNLYLLIHLSILWHLSHEFDGEAMQEQRTELRIATVAAQPLRGLDEKLGASTREADGFYGERLPQSYSQVLAELGVLSHRAGVKLTGAQYTPATVLPNSTGQLTELDIDSRLSGDYRPLMVFLNSLERDRMFFVIRSVTFNGQQSGTVNLRLHVTTYLRGGPPPPDAAASAAGTATAAVAAGGAR